MLTFLSDVKTVAVNRNEPKGPRKISVVPYNWLGEMKTTNESAIKYLLQSDFAGEPIQHIAKIFVFASKKVRQETVRAIDAGEIRGTDGKLRPPTHLEFFQGRLQGLPLAEDCLYIYDFDEGLPVVQAMEMTTDLAHQIHEFVAMYQDYEVVLHADMTGGLRHATMMLINIMRLLQYEQITIGKVLYSNYVKGTANRPAYGYVEEATEIYHMLDLIAGAEEFARFGSIQAIKDYFEQRKQDCSPELQDLLDAMNFFAEEIKLCHRATFVDAIDRLRSALQTFEEANAVWHPADEQASPKRLNDKLMLQLENRINADYAPLWDIRKDPLSAIRWCLEHDYLQQAITLYTEALPDYLFDTKHLLAFSDDLRKKVETARKNHAQYGLNFFFLNHYFRDESAWNDAEAKQDDLGRVTGKFRGFLMQKKFFQDLRKEERTPQQVYDAIQNFLFPYSSIYLARKGTLLETLKAYQKIGKKGTKKMDTSMIMSLCDDLELDIIYPLKCLIKQGRLVSRIPEAELLNIISSYRLLKKERNTENHAKNETGPFASATALRQYFEKVLHQLDVVSIQET